MNFMKGDAWLIRLKMSSLDIDFGFVIINLLVYICNRIETLNF